MRIGLIADTHGFLDETLFAYLSQCDEVWHAGDFGSVDVRQHLRQFIEEKAKRGHILNRELFSAFKLLLIIESVPVDRAPARTDPQKRKPDAKPVRRCEDGGDGGSKTAPMALPVP